MIIPPKIYFVVDAYSSSEFKLKSSVFIGHLKPAETIEQCKEFISEIAGRYKDATHNCWAYIVGDKAEIFHSSDSGEPAGTAGKPILNTLQKHNLTNIVAVVTRYYGGTKLGVRGLIEAYSESISLAVLNASLKRMQKLFKYQVNTTYDFAENLKHQLVMSGCEINSIDYSESVKLVINIEDTLNQNLVSYLSDLEKRNKLNFFVLKD